ncbi:MAG: helicase-associated domain-containing protein [Anaerolineae bacterium]|nr:helicase-associated domain-containing protein [Anaerolineae bacterium]
MTKPTLLEAIEAFNANDVATMLRHAGVHDVPKSKEGKSRLWLKQMTDPGRIRQALEKLTPRARQALQVLQAREGAELRTSRYRELLLKANIITSEIKRPTYGFSPGIQTPAAISDPRTFEEILAVLLLNGLVWCHTLPEGAPGNSRLGFEGGRYVYIPAEVAAHLPPVPARKRQPPQVEHILAASARTCQRDLYLVWSAAREEPFELLTTGLLRMSDLRRVAKQLLIPENITSGTRESDYRRILFLRRLLTAVGLLQEPRHTVAMVANPEPGFLQSPPADRVKVSFESWRDGLWWNELWATYVPGKTRASGSVTDFAPDKVRKARRKVLLTLAELVRKFEREGEGPAWVTLDELSETLRDRDEEFLLDRATVEQQYQAYRYSYYGSELSPYQFNAFQWQWEVSSDPNISGWDRVEREFIRGVLTEGLYWLGLVDLGYAEPVSQEGGKAPADLLAVRLTDMGRWLLLGGEKPAIPEETGRVVLQPNFRIFAFDPISDSVLAQLDSFATRLNAERAIEYELSRDSVYRALLAGQTTREIGAWLEQVTGAPLPQNVARSLEEWQTAFEQITVWQAVGWVEAARPELIEELLRSPELNDAVIRRVTPTGLVVRTDKISAIEKALLAAGELPLRFARGDEVHPGAVVVRPDGDIRPIRPVTDFYTRAVLAQFAERSGEGWRITPAAVARAAGRGMDAAAILERLSSLTHEAIPDGLQMQVKSWSKHYGVARISTLTLIQFRDQETLNDLRQDPELAKLLQPFYPEARLGLALVADRHRQELVRLLEARGVEVWEETGV